MLNNGMSLIDFILMLIKYEFMVFENSIIDLSLVPKVRSLGEENLEIIMIWNENIYDSCILTRNLFGPDLWKIFGLAIENVCLYEFDVCLSSAKKK